MINLNLIKNSFKNPDIQRLFGNFFSLSLLRLLNLILPFVTLPYLIKVLGISHYGIISIALSLSMYFEAITGYGFNLSATRQVALHRHSKNQLSFIYNNVMGSKIFLLILSLIILVPLILLIPQFNSNKDVYFFMLLYLVGQTFFPEWFFRGMEKMFYITILDFSIKISFTILVFIFINNQNDYWMYPLIYGLGFITISIIAHYIILKKFRLSFRLVSAFRIYTTLKRGFPLFVNQFFPTLYNNTTGFLVGILLGNYAAGLFNATRQLTNLLSVLNAIVTTTVYPYLSRNKSNFYIYRKYYLLFYTTITIVFLLCLKKLLLLINITDPNAFYIGLFLVCGLYFLVIYTIHSTNYLLIHNQDITVMKITIATSILGFIGSFIFILNLGVIGAAINIAITQGLMASSSYLIYINIKNKGLQ